MSDTIQPFSSFTNLASLKRDEEPGSERLINLPQGHTSSKNRILVQTPIFLVLKVLPATSWN